MNYYAVAGIAVLVILLQLSAVAAQELHRVDISLSSTGDAAVTNLFFLDSTNRTDFIVPVARPRNLRVYDAVGDLTFTLSDEDVTVVLREQQVGYSFTIEYETSSLTAKSGDEWTFSYVFFPSGNVDSSRLTLILPAGAQLLSQTPTGIVYLDNNRINIDFMLQSDEFITGIEVKYTLSSDGQPQEGNILLLVIGGVVVIVVIILTVIYFLKQPKREKQKIKEKDGGEKGFSAPQRDILKTLTANEEKIVHELFKHKKDGLTQKGLARETGIPKSTLSRTLKRLSVKSVVEIKDYGVTKKIRLTEWFLNK
jgi:uncharacterized membrane protein